MNVSQTLFTLALGLYLACPVAAQTQQPSSPSARPTPTLAFYYLRQVSSQKYPNRPVQATVTKNAQGNEQYTFFDQRSKETFHDGATIAADFAQVLAGGTQRRPGAVRYAVPASLNAQHTDPTVYFTLQQRARAAKLSRESSAWRHLLRTSPIVLTAADVEPNSDVSEGGGGTERAIIMQKFTARGTKKYAAFTRAHVGEVIGIVVDDKVISAPYIAEPITGGEGEISGGFGTLEEAKGVADQMNAAARAASEP